MRIAFGVIFVTGICGGYVLALPLVHISKDLDHMYNSYVALSNKRTGDDSNELDVISRVQQVFLKQAEEEPQTEKTYLMVKRLRQRNKRYVSYLTLCHFKICNMGHKRNTRYFHMIRRLGDNDS